MPIVPTRTARTQGDNGSATGYTRSVVDTANFGVLELGNIRGRANVTRQADGDVLRNAKGHRRRGDPRRGQEQPQPPAGEAQQFSGGEYTIRLVTLRPNGIDAQGAFVRLFNGTPDDRTDDTVVDLVGTLRSRPSFCATTLCASRWPGPWHTGESSRRLAPDGGAATGVEEGVVQRDSRTVLEQTRDRLTDELAVLTQRPEPGSGIGFGKRVGDATSVAVERITDVAKQEGMLAKLHETERALDKLDEGTYGRCDVCGTAIGDERLEFRPYATRCVQHAV